MENEQQLQQSEQVNVLLQGDEVETFREYMRDQVARNKSQAGYKLIIEGLRRWKDRKKTEETAA